MSERNENVCLYKMYMNVNNIFHNRTEAYPNVHQLING